MLTNIVFHIISMRLIRQARVRREGCGARPQTPVMRLLNHSDSDSDLTDILQFVIWLTVTVFLSKEYIYYALCQWTD